MPNQHPSIQTSGSGDTYVGVPTDRPLAGAIGAIVLAAATAYALMRFDIATGPLLIVVALSVVVGYLGGYAIGDSIDEAQAAGRWRFGGPPSAVPQQAEDLGRAYAFGIESRKHFAGESFDAVEDVLARQWLSARGPSRMYWENARDAVRSAWHHDTVTPISARHASASSTVDSAPTGWYEPRGTTALPPADQRLVETSR